MSGHVSGYGNTEMAVCTISQFRNCAAPVGRSAEPARALGTRRRCELCGRPAPVPGRAAPRASFPGVPRAARAAPEGGPGSSARPLRAPPRPALGELGRPWRGCGRLRSRGQRLRRRQEPLPAPPPPLPRAGEARRRAWRRAQCGAPGERGQRSWRPACSSGWCLWPGGRAGGRAAPPLRRAAG